jgi:hypothetical protein
MARNNGRDGIPRIGRPDGSASTPPSGNHYGDHSADSGPVDIAAVRRDDEFIEAIRGDGPIATGDADEYQLALLLANWRAEINEPAMPAGPDLDEVAAAIDSEIAAVGIRRKATRSSRYSLLRPVAGAAAAIAVVLGGLVVFSYNSAPGDPLWSVKSVVFAQQADSTVAQIDTTSKLAQAEQLIAQGDVSGAQTLLAGAAETTGGVIDQAQKSDLELWLQRLMEQIQAIAPTMPVELPSLEGLVPTVPDPGLLEVPVVPPVTSVPSPPVETTTDVLVPPDTSAPVSTVPTPPEVVQTVVPTPTVLLQPSPTTATASGSTGDGTPSNIDPSGNGG